MKLLSPASVLEITTAGSCTVRCTKYCPWEVYEKAFGNPSAMLSMGMFKKCLGHIPDTAKIVFSGFCEPFLNPNCAEFIKYAHEQGHRIAIYTTLVGFKLEYVEEIKDIPFLNFALHLPDAYGIANIPITSTYKDVVTAVLTNIPCSFVSMSSIEPPFKSCNRENVCRGLVKSSKHYPVTCISLCYKKAPVLVPDGRVALCCFDFGLNHVLGNLANSEWGEVIKGPEMKKVLRSNKSFTNTYSLCKQCSMSKNYIGFAVTCAKLALMAMRRVEN